MRLSKTLCDVFIEMTVLIFTIMLCIVIDSQFVLVVNSVWFGLTSPLLFGFNLHIQYTTRSFLYTIISDVRYVSIYRNIDIFVEYRDTILAFGCINTLEWAV